LGERGVVGRGRGLSRWSFLKTLEILKTAPFGEAGNSSLFLGSKFFEPNWGDPLPPPLPNSEKKAGKNPSVVPEFPTSSKNSKSNWNPPQLLPGEES
jgi:hypothetical protein